MVNLSPTEESYGESLCSLRLAKQIGQCELGKPKKQISEVGAAASAAASVGSTPRKPGAALSQSMGQLTAANAAPAATPKLMTSSFGSRKVSSASNSNSATGARKVAKK